MLAALTLLRLGRMDRDLWLYDTFAGMTPPVGRRRSGDDRPSARAILAERTKSADDPFWGVAAREVVEEPRRTGYPRERIHMIEGDVLATIPATRAAADRVAASRHRLVRVDAPRAHAPRPARHAARRDDRRRLRLLARRTKATDEYLATLQPRPLLQRIDYTGRLFVQP